MQNNLTSTHNDGVMQPFPYVSYDMYKSKYIELFGNDSNLSTDLKNVNSAIANDCSGTSLSGNNICWNGTGASPYTIELFSENISSVENNNYKLTGIYEKYNDRYVIVESWSFEIEYVKNETTKYLTSIKLIKE